LLKAANRLSVCLGKVMANAQDVYFLIHYIISLKKAGLASFTFRRKPLS
jgi:hypothetical protein